MANPNDFDAMLRQEQAQRDQAQLDAARTEQHQVEHEQQLAAMTAALQQDAARVAVAAAQGRVPEDAERGRFIRHTIGWYVDVWSASIANGPDSDWSTQYAKGLILSREGTLYTGSKVSNASTQDALRRELRKVELSPTQVTSESDLGRYRRQLARFALDHSLEV